MRLVIAFEEIFRKHVIIDGFSVYFDSILNEKLLLSYRNNDISCTHARGNAAQREICLKKLQFSESWCYISCSWFILMIT